MSNVTTDPTWPGPGPGSAGETGSQVASAAGSVAGTVKDEATGLASSAAEEALKVAAQAKDQVRTITSSATDSARSVLQETTAEARSQADQRVRQAADGMRTASDQLRALAEGRAQDAGAIGDYARQAAEKMSQLARRMEEGGIGGLLDETGRFARRRPLVFLVTAAGAGFVLGRFLRHQGGSGPAGPPQVSGSMPAMPPPVVSDVGGITAGPPVDDLSRHGSIAVTPDVVVTEGPVGASDSAGH
jgi:hypothetical protein